MNTTTTERCQRCNGLGEVPMHYPTGRRSVACNWERCRGCNGRGVVEVEGPDSPSPATITVAGHTLYAPTFTADSFDRAIMRAHDEGLQVMATDRRDMVLVSNPTHGTCYTVSRTTCDCKAGQRGIACKHRALAIFLADVMHQLPVPTVPAAA